MGQHGRQTDLTLSELVDILKNGKESKYPPCMLLNEVGELAREGDIEAQNILFGYLNSESEEDKFIAYAHLADFPQKSPEILEHLEKFINNEENSQIILEVQEVFGIDPQNVLVPSL